MHLPLARRAGRAQGQHLHPPDADHRLVADPRALSSALRRHGGRAARERRRGDCRQDQLRRVRDGVVDRELGLRRDPQPVESGADSRRIERRIGGRGGRPAGAARARLGHRRLDPAAGGALRRARPQADLRPRLALRPARVRVVARSDRSDRDDGRRCGAGASVHRRTRSARRDLGRRAGARFHRRGERRLVARPARRRAARADGGRRGAGRAEPPCDQALDVLASRGATLVDVDLPHSRHGIAALLPDRDRGGELEPGALRRRPLRRSRAGRRADADRDVRAHAADWASAPRSSAGSCSAPTC